VWSLATLQSEVSCFEFSGTENHPLPCPLHFDTLLSAGSGQAVQALKGEEGAERLRITWWRKIIE
jgi:hypothetical protein